MQNLTLSAHYFYLGSLNQSGEKTTLSELRQDHQYGLPVCAIDINPGCVSPPFRVFAGCAAYEALEVLESHCRAYPGSKISKRILQEISPADFEWAPFVLKIRNKYFSPAEDWITGIEPIKNPAMISEQAGGAYRGVAMREFPDCGLEMSRNSNGEVIIWGMTPGRKYFEFAPANKNQSPAEQATEAWKNASEKKFVPALV